MQTRRLGRAGPEISMIGFGAWEAGGRGWGENPPDEDVIRAIHAGIDAGVNWIDTAEIYGHGRSEELVGRALTGRRDDAFIFTKVAPTPSGTGFHADEVRAACEGSLARLGVETIDVYQLHWTDRGVPIEETWGAMGELVDAGLVRWIGVSNFGLKLIRRCDDERHVDSLQPKLSLLHPRHRDLAAACGELGIGVVPYSPLGVGLLAGVVGPDTRFPDTDWRSGKLWESELYGELFAPDRIGQSLAVADGLRAIAVDAGCTMAQLALAWLLAQPGVTAPIVGTRDAEHIREDAGVASVSLDEAMLARIDALIPLGPAAD